MPRKVHTHLPTDTQTPTVLLPKHMTKKEFGRRVYNLMMARGWNQSELGRQADLPRDSISTYIRGKTLPTPQKLEALAKALNVKPEELLPNHTESAIDEENPAFEMKVSGSAPGMAWIRVNRLVSMATAIKIADLLEHDRVLDRSGSSDAAAV